METSKNSQRINTFLISSSSVGNLTIGRMVNQSEPVTSTYSAQLLGTGTMTDNLSKHLNTEDSSTSKDTFVVFLTLTIMSATLYFSYYLWKKHKHRSLSALSKLEEYRYSRLSQNEIDVDNEQFTDTVAFKDEYRLEQECDDQGLKPATLQLETDSLITILDENSSHIKLQNHAELPSCNGQNSYHLIDDLSDEQDLLQ